MAFVAPDTAMQPWYITHARVVSKPHQRVKLADTCSFFRQLTTLLLGGSPLLDAIRVAGGQSESLRLQDTMAHVTSKIAGGSTFFQAAGEYPEVFEPYWVQLLRAGELSGKLPEILQRLVRHLEQSSKNQAKFIGAMAYPLILLLISGVALFVMMWKVVPTFTLFFKDFGGTVPPITKFVIALASHFEAYGVYMIVGAVAAGSLVRNYLRTESGLRNVTNGILVIPSVGDLAVSTAMQKFSSNLALLLKSGTPLLEAVEICKSLFLTFPAYRDALTLVHARVSGGKDVASSLDRARLFTPLLVNMVRVGEESGSLPEVLDQLDVYYADRVNQLVETVSALMEPAIIIFMGVVVGGLLSSIYIPMFKMASGAKD